MKRLGRTAQQHSGPLADIAFLLLIFFLVTTTMQQEAGIPTDLPPPGAAIGTSKKVLSIVLNANNEFMIDGNMVEKEACRDFVSDNLKAFDELSVQLKTNDNASYDAYLQLYDAVRSAYLQLYEEEAFLRHGVAFDALNTVEKRMITSQYPMRIMEPEPL